MYILRMCAELINGGCGFAVWKKNGVQPIHREVLTTVNGFMHGNKYFHK